METTLASSAGGGDEAEHATNVGIAHVKVGVVDRPESMVDWLDTL